MSVLQQVNELEMRFVNMFPDKKASHHFDNWRRAREHVDMKSVITSSSRHLPQGFFTELNKKML